MYLVTALTNQSFEATDSLNWLANFGSNLNRNLLDAFLLITFIYNLINVLICRRLNVAYFFSLTAILASPMLNRRLFLKQQMVMPPIQIKLLWTIVLLLSLCLMFHSHETENEILIFSRKCVCK